MKIAMHMSRKKMAIWGAIILVVGFAGWKLFFPQKAAVQYQTSVAEKGTLITTVSASGNISNGNSIDITSSATGAVTNVYVKIGDTVVAGQKIADISLDQSSTQRELSAWGNYLGAKNQLASAQANYNSLQAAEFKANQAFINDAVMRGLATDDPTYIQENAAWLQAQANYQNQATVIAQNQVSVQTAWLAYQQITPNITAPEAGIITNLVLAPGLSISSTSSTNSSGNVTAQVFGTITPTTRQSQAVVNVSEIDVVTIKAGQKATLTLDAFPNQTFTGKVLVVNTSGAVSSGVTTYPTTIALDTTPDTIYPNMAVSAKIITAVKDNVILVPSAAVQTTSGTSTVRVLKNGQVSSVTVEVGSANDTQTEIVSGVTEGDNVVTSAVTSTGATQTGSTSPFSAIGGNRGFGAAGGGAVRVIGR
jgi:membrane fusion protein, macrolide-specific efflux system